MKNTGISSWGIVLFISSNHKRILLRVWDFLGVLKKYEFFGVDKFWSWDFFEYKIWTSVDPSPQPPPPPRRETYLSGNPFEDYFL